MLRVAGIVALIVLLAACDQTTAKTVASPSPVIAQGTWTEGLTFTGDLPGQMTGIVADTGDLGSACTGSKSRVGDVWADTFYGTLDPSGVIWGVVFTIKNFSGPGTYASGAMTVEMHNTDHSQVWLTLDGDKVTFAIDRTQQSGTLDATMTNATTGKVAAEHVAGRWNCRG
ncbi:MAG: hypothetical protein ACYDAL_04105 [Candidatus Dormibacteraceae bacterium]